MSDVEQFDPAEFRSVVVRLDNGAWVFATLEAYRDVEGSWMGFVRYKLLDGESHAEWVTADRIRL